MTLIVDRVFNSPDLLEVQGRTLLVRVVPYGQSVVVRDKAGPPYREGFDPGAFAGAPRAFGRDFDQRDLIARPGARRGAMDGERRGPSAVLDQRHADERRRHAVAVTRAVFLGEPRVRLHVADRDRLAAAAS